MTGMMKLNAKKIVHEARAKEFQKNVLIWIATMLKENFPSWESAKTKSRVSKKSTTKKKVTDLHLVLFSSSYETPELLGAGDSHVLRMRR
jgi:hypothetical protein